MEERGNMGILVYREEKPGGREKEMREGVTFFLEKKTGDKRASSH